MPPTSAPTASPSLCSKTATTHPTSPATAHAAVASGADMTRRCMLARPGFPSSPAPGSSPPRCHLRPGSTAPAATGKRTESPGDRYRAEGLRRAGSRGQGYEGGLWTAALPVPAILRELRPQRFGAWQTSAPPPRGRFWEFEFLLCSWDAVLGVVTTAWVSAEIVP